MVYRVIFTLTTGFALLSGSACLGQAETAADVIPSSRGTAAEQTNLPVPAGSATQTSKSTDRTTIARWWQRFSPPPVASGQPANNPTTTAAPAAQAATNPGQSTWYFGKLLKGSDRKRDQADLFAVKPASYEEASPKPAVPVTESTEPKAIMATPISGVNDIPPEATAGNSLTPTAVGACPYPDTGIHNLYSPTQAETGSTISDHAEAPVQPPTPGSVRSAFDGILGRDDARTKKEAESLPLLSPYKDLPVGYAQLGAGGESSKQSSSAKPSSASAVNQSNDSGKQQSVVGAAFTLPASDEQNKVSNAHGPGNESRMAVASSQATSPQPLQLNGVEAHQLTGTPLNRPKVIYRPGASVIDNAGHKMIKPEVQVAADSATGSLPTSVQLAQFAAAGEGVLPAPANIAPETAYPIDDQQWMPSMNGFDSGACDSCQGGGNGHGWLHGRRDCCRSGAIGVEHVTQAPFFIQTTEPFNNCRVRLDLARDLEFPDRSEFFWAKTPGGKGPAVTSSGIPVTVGEPSVNYQDLDFYIEKGTKRLSIGTDLPIRAVDPEIRDDSTGFSDMAVRTKAVLVDGTNWQLTQLFNTYLPTGSVHHGTGNGHVSLEPGVAYRWKWSDWTYFHGDLKYLFPISADPDFAGQIFNYGFGWSHVLLETDTYALIPTFEVENWTFVDGRQTIPFPLVPAASEEVNTIGIMNICPGLRWVCDKGCDCGTKEFGICAGISVTNEHLYDEILRLEFRWSR